MVEPVSLTLGAIAAALVAKATEKTAEAAVDGGAGALSGIVAWLRKRFSGPEDNQGATALARIEDAPDSPSRLSRILFGIRSKLGEWFGWDDAKLPIPGESDSSLAGRLPADLKGTTAGADFGSLPFDPLFKTDREAAAEISNQTVRAMMHLGWVDKGHGDFQGQMAVLVKPRGRFGKTYMDLIKPFRLWIVYPAVMRQIERAWDKRRPRSA